MQNYSVAYVRLPAGRGPTTDLDLWAQRLAVTSHLRLSKTSLLCEYVDYQSGRKFDPSMLQEALKHCRQVGATLVITRLGSLSRSPACLSLLYRGGVEFIALDLPELNHNTVADLARQARAERESINEKVRAALAEAKAQGVKLGNPRGAETQATWGEIGRAARRARADQFALRVAPMIYDMREKGYSFPQIAATLNQMNVSTRRGGTWSAQKVSFILKRAKGLKDRAVPQKQPGVAVQSASVWLGAREGSNGRFLVQRFHNRPEARHTMGS